jgi:uncharacterized protein YjbI with pentapeptide repeats
LSRALLRVTSLASADLSNADLSHADLSGANLANARLLGARLRAAKLGGVDLFSANLSGVDLRGADLRAVDLSHALLSDARLDGARIGDASHAILNRASLRECDLRAARLDAADLTDARLQGARLQGANLVGATLAGANLTHADLSNATLIGANLSGAILRYATLRGANLASSVLNLTDLRDADLSGAHVYGMSAWDLRLDRAKQQDLSITPERDAMVLVDNLEVAQFLYLLLNNARIKNVIETLNAKSVLILGRFTPQRMRILQLIRAHLRTRDMVPILFDFEKPKSRSLLETVAFLAHMSKLVLADLTDASFIKRELPMILGQLRIPVQPLLLDRRPEPKLRLTASARKRLAPLLRYKSGPGLLRDLDRLLATAARGE